MRPLFALTAFATVAGVSVCACAMIPALVFEPEDAGVDGPSAGGDSGTSGVHDAASTDAKAILDARLDDVASPPADAANDALLPPNTCPGAVPPGATLCCGSIPCTGANAKKCTASCPSCQGACNVGQTCCLDKAGAFTGCSAVACP